MISHNEKPQDRAKVLLREVHARITELLYECTTLGIFNNKNIRHIRVE